MDIHEPGLDWVCLAAAPFHYFGKHGFIRINDEAWRDELRELLLSLKPRSFSGWLGKKQIKIEFSSGRPFVFVKADEWRLLVAVDEGFTGLLGNDDTVPMLSRDGARPFWCTIDEFWKDMNTIPAKEEVKFFHEWLLSFLSLLQLRFADCVRSGAAHLMARKHSPLAPFERIHLDQWRNFKVDEDKSEKEKNVWCDPRPRPDDPFVVTPEKNATAPNGEKLYSIYVAPGAPLDASDRADLDAERKCRDYLRREMLGSPNAPPFGTVGATLADCRKKFPGLPGRAIDRAYGFARADVGSQANWSKRGPRKKLPAAFPAEENHVSKTPPDGQKRPAK
jgi:hypothetical protein